MAAHNELGKKGEDAACNYLVQKGFNIMARNWRYRHLEVDIIAMDGPTLVFVEVKTRSFSSNLSDLISHSKIRFLENAVEAYVNFHRFEGDVRIDLVSVCWVRGQLVLEHIPNAFR